MERENVPVTFGQLFRQGDVKHGIVVRVGQEMIPAQIDVKRRFDDGSVRFAVISTVLKNVPGGEQLTLALCDGPSHVDARAPAAISELPDTVVQICFSRWYELAGQREEAAAGCTPSRQELERSC